MDWRKANNDDTIDHADNDSTLCPTCQEKVLQRKLDKIKFLNEYQRSQEDIVLLEQIKKELERIKKEKETQLLVFLCKKHKNTNSNSA
ncbi:hypothetical protein [Spiroplasma endosymbiont of Nebria brevicollis]|uniref:hypothetical protein n=1 Tax=Spiroplasma endosymbiont of Nebria brevicollis TaxID=3066284 RepID=UPI00313F1654